MKKILLIVAAAIFSMASMAQSSVTYGVRGGLTNSTFKGDAASSLQQVLDYTNGKVSATSRTGFYAGAFATIPLGGNISVESGINYAQKGYNLIGELGVKGLDFIGANAKAQLQNNYIDIPVLLKANFGKLSIGAGPQFSYLANANLCTTAGLLGINLLNKNIDVTDQFNRWDVAVKGGAAYQITKNIAINATCDYGLAKPDKNKSVNSNIQTGNVGLAFRF